MNVVRFSKTERHSQYHFEECSDSCIGGTRGKLHQRYAQRRQLFWLFHKYSVHYLDLTFHEFYKNSLKFIVLGHVAGVDTACKSSGINADDSEPGTRAEGENTPAAGARASTTQGKL